MSLDSLMRHFVTIQQAENPAQTDEGFVDYTGSWINKFVNVRCNIQYKRGKSIVLDGHKLEEVSKTIVYHQNTEVWNYLQDTPAIRLIVWRTNFSSSLGEPELLRLKDNTNRSLFNIYIMKANINVTEGQIGTRLRVYQIEVEKSERMKF